MPWPSLGMQAGTVVIAFLISALTCELWIHLAGAHVADLPGQRRMHGQITPRGGGVGIALVVLAAIAWQWQTSEASRFILSGMLIGVAIVALAGLLDDLRRIGTAKKFLLQSLAAICIAGAWLSLSWPAIVIGIAAAFIVLVLINFWNFMDGSNGMAATQAVLVALTLALLAQHPAPRLLALALMASSAGFLPFNLPKARLFMGDVGSHVIGACLAALIIWELSSGDIGPFQAFVLVSAFAMDAGLTLARRIITGRRFWQAHREHLYQMAIRKGYSHSQVCLAYAVWTGLAAVLTMAIATQPLPIQAGTAIAVAASSSLIYVGLRQRWLLRSRPLRVRP